MGPFEQEIAALLEGPSQNTMASLFYAAGDTNHWFHALHADERQQVILLGLAGISDAVRRIAREIDESRGAIADDGSD